MYKNAKICFNYCQLYTCKLSGLFRTADTHKNRCKIYIIMTESNCNHAGQLFCINFDFQIFRTYFKTKAYTRSLLSHLFSIYVFQFCSLVHSWKNSKGCGIPTDQWERSIPLNFFSKTHNTPLYMFLYRSFTSFIC